MFDIDLFLKYKSSFTLVSFKWFFLKQMFYQDPLFFSCLKNLKNVQSEYWHLDYKSLNLAFSHVVSLELKPMWLVSTCNLSPVMAPCHIEMSDNIGYLSFNL